ncbi:MAG: class I tRNA ligase family protein, partial [Vicinamibacteria bacterium]
RGQPNGFMGDPDIMDTWATSSLTPQIVSGWGVDPALFAQVFPLSLRPQAHDIIRTWLFTTVLRAELEHGSLPWAHTAISGWVLDPDRKKMSKSKGNVVTPTGLLDEHGSDAVRYWAASGGPGVDTAFDPAQMKVGRRLAIKLLNASKFILAGDLPLDAQSQSFGGGQRVTAPLDRGMLTNLAALVADVTGALDDYDYAKALQRTEAFFWDFCDNYVELVKARRYGDAKIGGATVAEGQASAQAALRTALEVLLRLFAPYLPFATEEVWSWWRTGSVHHAAWPTPAEVLTGLGGAADSEAQRGYERAQTLSAEVRRQKAALKVSQKTRVTTLRWVVPSEWIAEVRAIEADARGALHIDALELVEGGSGEVTLTLELPPDGTAGAAA